MEADILDRIKRSYLLKFLLAIVLLVGLIGSVGVFTYVQTTQQLQMSAEDRSTAAAELGAIELERWLNDHESTLQNTASDDAYESGRDVAETHLQQQYQVISAPDDLLGYHYVQRETGRVIASAGKTELAQNETFPHGWYGSNMRFRDGVYVSPVYTVEDQQRIALLSEVSGQDTLVMELNASAFIDRLETPSDDSFISLVNENGVIVGSDVPEFVGNSYNRDTRRRITSPDGQDGFLEARGVRFADNTNYLIAYATVPRDEPNAFGFDEDTAVVVHIPQSQAYRLSRDIARNLLIIVAVALFGLGLLGATLVRGTVKDLNRLTSKTAELERGNLDVELDSDRKDEFGQLYNRFAGMRDRMKQRIVESQSARATAREAQAELEKRNESLRKQQTITSVLNRVLRHNIRNRLTVLLGAVSLLRDADDEEQERQIERMTSIIQELEETAQKARSIEQIVQNKSALEENINVTALLQSEVSSLRNHYPEAEIKTDLPPGVTANTHESIKFAFRNIMENGIKHNDSDNPQITVSLADAGESVVVTVTDNGPGIPATELDILESGVETDIEHGSGLGLWVVTWLVSEMNGRIEFEESEPTGTCVTIELDS